MIIWFLREQEKWKLATKHEFEINEQCYFFEVLTLRVRSTEHLNNASRSFFASAVIVWIVPPAGPITMD